MGPNPYCLEKGVNSQDTMCFEGFKGHLPRPLVRRSPKSRRVGRGLGPHSGELLAALLRESSLTQTKGWRCLRLCKAVVHLLGQVYGAGANVLMMKELVAKSCNTLLGPNREGGPQNQAWFQGVTASRAPRKGLCSNLDGAAGAEMQNAGTSSIPTSSSSTEKTQPLPTP